MWELVKAGGWLMIPLVLCSIFTVAITIERFIRLKRSMVLPKELLLSGGQDVHQVVQQLQNNQNLQLSSLGRILVSGLNSQKQTEQYQKVFKIFRENKDKLTSVTFWNITDKYTWLDNYPVPGRKNYPLLFDANYQPKQAYWSVINFK